MYFLFEWYSSFEPRWRIKLDIQWYYHKWKITAFLFQHTIHPLHPPPLNDPARAILEKINLE